LPLDRTAEPSVYLQDGFRNQLATFSPDGKWLAYTSDETGKQQVFVRSFPDPAKAKHQVSNEAAAYPRWRRDGREFFFVDSMNRVSVTSVDLQAGFAAGPPTPLFEFPRPASVTGDVSLGAVFDVSPDGQPFFLAAPRAVTAGVTLTVAVNWTAGRKP